MAKADLSWGGILLRLVAALVLVYATYNPQGVSYFHWAIQAKTGETGLGGILHGFTPLKAFAGLVLVAAWVVFLQAAQRSLGAGGAILVVGLFACTIWAMIYYGVISPTSSKAIANLILIAVSLVLAIGMSWSHISRRLSGQMDTDNVG
ncbi:MAG: DUF6524 family protein [Gemmatimonadales bacterium]